MKQSMMILARYMSESKVDELRVEFTRHAVKKVTKPGYKHGFVEVAVCRAFEAAVQAIEEEDDVRSAFCLARKRGFVAI